MPTTSAEALGIMVGLLQCFPPGQWNQAIKSVPNQISGSNNTQLRSDALFAFLRHWASSITSQCKLPDTLGFIDPSQSLVSRLSNRGVIGGLPDHSGCFAREGPEKAFHVLSFDTFACKLQNHLFPASDFLCKPHTQLTISTASTGK